MTELGEKEVRIRFEPGVGPEGAREEAHTYAQLLEETRKALLKAVSRDRAVIDLFRMEQGSRSFMEYLSEVEDQTNLCMTWEPLTEDDLQGRRTRRSRARSTGSRRSGSGQGRWEEPRGGR